MRKDMKRVIITRPRHGSSLKNEDVRYQRRTHRDDNETEKLSNKSSMKPKGKFSWYRKSLSDFLNPLLRFLRKKCGQPWNKVYAEICENLDRRGVINDHIFQHLEQYVLVKPLWVDGKPHTTGYEGPVPLYKNGRTFYVDKAGVLCQPKNPRPKRERKEYPNFVQTENDMLFYVKRPSDNVWFEVSIDPKSEVAITYPWEVPHWISDLVPYRFKNLIKNNAFAVKTLSKKQKKKILSKRNG